MADFMGQGAISMIPGRASEYDFFHAVISCGLRAINNSAVDTVGSFVLKR